MNGVQGAIHFVVTGDETDLLRALSSSRSAIIASGDTAEKEGAKIEQMFKRATSSVSRFLGGAGYQFRKVNGDRSRRISANRNSS